MVYFIEQHHAGRVARCHTLGCKLVGQRRQARLAEGRDLAELGLNCRVGGFLQSRGVTLGKQFGFLRLPAPHERAQSHHHSSGQPTYTIGQRFSALLSHSGINHQAA